MADSIIQPNDSQTFLLKYSYSGPEFNYNCKEILQVVKNTYPSGNYDTIVLLPYAMYPFGYFIGYFSIGTVNILNLTNNQLTTVGHDQYVAMDYLFDGNMNFESINETGDGLLSKGSTPWYSRTESGKDWKYITVTYPDPLVFYTECNFSHMYINGQEYIPEPVGDAEVKVSYIVPDDEYTYCNITWKMNSEPEDKDDGHTATLLKDESVINITNLVEGAKYIFKIFTNKSESNPFPYTVGPSPEPPEPETNDIIIYKNGRIRRSDSIIDNDIYVTTFSISDGTAAYASKSINLHAANTSYYSGRFNYTMIYAIDLNRDNNMHSIPIVSTISQNYNTRTKLSNKAKITFDFELTMESGSMGLCPRFYSGNEYNGNSTLRYTYIAPLLTDLTHVSGNYIYADSSTSFTISETLEATVFYYDYNSGSSYSITDQSPHLWLELMAYDYSGLSVFDMKINIKEIAVEMNYISFPKLEDGFYIYNNNNGRNYKTIEEIYDNVKELGFNTFVLSPINVKSGNTVYWVCPFTMTVPNDLYIARDFYLTRDDSDSRSFFAIGYQDMPDEIPCYYISLSTGKLMYGGSILYCPYSETRDGITYKFARCSTISNATSYVFYTEGYKRLYVNNVLMHEKKT